VTAISSLPLRSSNFDASVHQVAPHATLSALPLRLAVHGVARPFTHRLERARGLRHCAGAEQYAVEERALEAATLAELAALSRPAQDVVWLEWLLYFWGGPYDGLHTFMYLNVEYASDVHAALVAVGSQLRADVFARAREFFRASSYPADLLGGRVPYDPDFAKRAQALGDEFGDRAGYTRELDAYVERTPDLLAWVRSAVASPPDEDRLACLVARLREVAGDDTRAFATWPRPHQLVYLADVFEAEVLEAMSAFFCTPSADRAPEVLVALRELGLASHADVLGEGIAAFGDPYPAEVGERRALVERSHLKWELNAMTGCFYDEGALRRTQITVAKDADILPR
jgi:hypothetical protein